MKEVTLEEFYAVINPLTNLQCEIVNKWDDEIGYITEFRQGNRLIGKSQSGDCHGQGKNKKFWLAN